MELKERLYISLSKLAPRGYIEFYKKMLTYAGNEENVYSKLGSSVLLSIIFAVIPVLYIMFLTSLNWIFAIPIAILSVILIQVVFYLITYLTVEKRSEKVEKILPDMMQIIANNVKSGMTPHQALSASAREEFEPLSSEIKNAVKEGTGVKSFTTALLDIRKRIKSVMLERVLKLLSSSFKTGGNLSILLNDIANDIRETQALKKDMQTKTKTYMAFILFTVIFGTPLLLAISIHFVGVVSEFSEIQSLSSEQSASFDLGIGGGAAIDPGYLSMLAYILLGMTTLLASLLLGVINKGKATSGIRFFLPLMFIVFLLFTGFRYAVSLFFQSMG
jgi:pilus assembly protein TadC